MPPSSSFLNQCVSCLHITFHSRSGRLRCSVTALSCWGSQTHISLSHLFLSHHFLSVFLLFYLFHHLPSTSSLPLCFVALICHPVNIISSFHSLHFPLRSHLSVHTSVLPSFLPKGSHWLLSHGKSRNGRIRSRERDQPLSQWPAFCGSNAFFMYCRFRRLKVCCSCMRLALPMRSFASRCVCCLQP